MSDDATIYPTIAEAEELIAAQKALLKSNPLMGAHEASSVLMTLFKLGFRVAYVGKAGDE